MNLEEKYSHPDVGKRSALEAAAPDLLEACRAAKKYLEPDLVEPGRTVFWKLVDAIRKAEPVSEPSDAGVIPATGPTPGHEEDCCCTACGG